MIIIDDPLKPEEALSQTQRRAANEWFDHTLYSRLNDKIAGAIVVIMHRPHEDDLVGHVLAQEDWEVVRFPAVAEDDKTLIVDTLRGPKTLTRHQGEALHPAGEPLAMIEHLCHMIREYNFAGQYQQMPTPLGSGLVKRAWFRHYAASALLYRMRAEELRRGQAARDPPGASETASADPHSTVTPATGGCNPIMKSRPVILISVVPAKAGT